MLNVFKVPVQVYQACAAYASETGEEVYVNDLSIGEDARAFIRSVSCVGGKMKLNSIYLTSDVHATALRRTQTDLEKVNAFMAKRAEETKDEG